MEWSEIFLLPIIIPINIFNIRHVNISYWYYYLTDKNFRIISGFLYKYYFIYTSRLKSIQLYYRMKECNILDKEYEFRMYYGVLRNPMVGVFSDKKQILAVSFCRCCYYLGITEI